MTLRKRLESYWLSNKVAADRRGQPTVERVLAQCTQEHVIAMTGVMVICSVWMVQNPEPGKYNLLSRPRGVSILEGASLTEVLTTLRRSRPRRGHRFWPDKDDAAVLLEQLADHVPA